MRPRDISKCVDHCENSEAESQRNPDMRNSAAAHLIDHDRASASEHEHEGSNELSRVSLQDIRGVNAFEQAPWHHCSIFTRIWSRIFRTSASFS